ncbi:MAG: universal stress protein [Planctomycetota bacterium]|jgi:nucleotide-binding universal stress UspA family protein
MTLSTTPFVNSVFHPSDFSETSRNAFAHALAIALMRQTKFTILHVGDSKDEWTSFPTVRKTLEKWGLLQKNSPRSAVFEELAVRVKKVSLKGRNPAAAITAFLKDEPTDLIVLSTEARKGLTRLIKPSVAEKVFQKSKTMTLFVPANAPGFVNPNNGSFQIKRILLPMTEKPKPDRAVTYAKRIASMAGQDIEIIFLHVTDVVENEHADVMDAPFCKAKRVIKPGDVVEGITATAAEYQTDLIIMTTAGHDSLSDMLQGSVTEQVLREAPCALLAVPNQ